MAHIRIENDYLRTQEFLKFTGTAEYRVLLFLVASIVRKAGKHAPPGAVKMYDKYYKDKKLCASYSMSNIAKYFCWGTESKPNKSYVSRIINNLKEMGLVKIRTENTPEGKKYVYELGYYDISDSGSIIETLYFDKYFSKFVKKDEKSKPVASEEKKEPQPVLKASPQPVQNKKPDFQRPAFFKDEDERFSWEAYNEEYGEKTLYRLPGSV